MTLSERTLRKWRKEALRQREISITDVDLVTKALRNYFSNITLKMTQELLDLHLLKK